MVSRVTVSSVSVEMMQGRLLFISIKSFSALQEKV